jgi:VanZ family protein
MHPASTSLSANPRFRWTMWIAFLALWTIGLLAPITNVGPLEDMPIGRKYIVMKSAHVSAYALLTILSGWLNVSIRYRWLLLFFIMAHAPVTELLQIPVGRGGSLDDVGYDHLGVFLGLLMTWKWWSRIDP